MVNPEMKEKVDTVNKNITDLLRLPEEPCQSFNEEDIHRILVDNVIEFMDLLERFYLAWQKDNGIVIQPKKQLFTTSEFKGDLRVMPCIIDGFEGRTIKAVKVIGTNEEEKIIKDKICVGKALLVNTTDNFVEGMFDVCALSSFRTAAISVLAYRHAADIKEKQIGIIGTGRIAYYTALILNSWLGIERIHACDKNPDMLDRFYQLIGEQVDVSKQPLSSLCKYSQAVFLATTSEQPVLGISEAGGIPFISSVGADADNLCELDKSLAAGRHLISESRQNIYFGDMNRWRSEGLISTNDITELRSLVGCQTKIRPCLFISTGTAVQDALVCQFIKDHAGRSDQ